MQLEAVSYFFFSSTIIKYSSSLSAHIALCPGSLGKMSSSKAICQVCQMCFSELFQLFSPLFMWNTVSFMKLLTPSGFFQQKTPVFHQSCLKTVFHSGLGALGSAFQVLTSMVVTCRVCLGYRLDTRSPPVCL